MSVKGCFVILYIIKKPKRPKDTNQLAKTIVDIAIQGKEDVVLPSTKNIHAVELGRLGGLKGGKARATKLSAKKRSEIAKKAALVRWKKGK